MLGLSRFCLLGDCGGCRPPIIVSAFCFHPPACLTSCVFMNSQALPLVIKSRVRAWEGGDGGHAEQGE